MLYDVQKMCYGKLCMNKIFVIVSYLKFLCADENDETFALELKHNHDMQRQAQRTSVLSNNHSDYGDTMFTTLS